jgi:hypothetical protein
MLIKNVINTDYTLNSLRFSSVLFYLFSVTHFLIKHWLIVQDLFITSASTAAGPRTTGIASFDDVQSARLIDHNLVILRGIEDLEDVLSQWSLLGLVKLEKQLNVSQLCKVKVSLLFHSIHIHLQVLDLLLKFSHI